MDDINNIDLAVHIGDANNPVSIIGDSPERTTKGVLELFSSPRGEALPNQSTGENVMKKAKKRGNSIRKTPQEMALFGKKMKKLVSETTTLELNRLKGKGVI